MSIGINRIDHINIVVKNLDKVQQFFIALGFELKDQSKLEGASISRVVDLKDVKAEYIKMALPNDSVALELICYTNPPPLHLSNLGEANAMGFRHIAFRVTDIEKSLHGLKKIGIEPLSAIEEYRPTEKKLFYFRGPEDILLELAEYGKAETSLKSKLAEHA